MSIANFSITKPLEKKINQVIKTQGFTSKAEFFRFAALMYIQNLGRSKEPTDAEYESSMNELAQAMRKAYEKKPFPRLEEQLADLR